ncbi:MAG: hypothetical protein WBM96_17180, partial [Polyangiales bacterium]
MRCVFMVAVMLASGPVGVAAADPEAGAGTGTDTGTDAGTDAGTDTDAGADTDKPSPKIAVVVAGDPDDTLGQTAAFIEREATLSGLRVPTDPALRAAMRGE